jgi:hypothetical protein
MTRDDLLDRLAAANPETADGPPDEHDALLASLEADIDIDIDIGAAPSRPRRFALPRLTPVLAGALVVVLALTAIVARDVLDDGPEHDALAAKVYAALTDDHVIYHSVAVLTSRGLDGSDDGTRLVEQWTRGDGRAERQVVYELRNGRRGAKVFELAFDPRHPASLPDETPSSGFDPTAGYRAAYKRGDVRSRGTVVVKGRRLLRLETRTTTTQNIGAGVVLTSQTELYLVDPGTLLPVEERVTGVGRDGYKPIRLLFDNRYRVYEKLPDTAANRKLLRGTY